MYKDIEIQPAAYDEAEAVVAGLVAEDIAPPTTVAYWFKVFDATDDRFEYGEGIRALQLNDEQNELFISVSATSQALAATYDDAKLVANIIGGFAQEDHNLLTLAAIDGLRAEVLRRGATGRRPAD